MLVRGAWGQGQATGIDVAAVALLRIDESLLLFSSAPLATHCARLCMQA